VAEMFGSSKRPESSGARRLAGLIVALAAVGVAVYWFKAHATAGEAPAPSAAVASSAPHVPKNVPVPGVTRPVAAGAFQMGSDDGDKDEKPVHEVKVAAFELDETEVTVKAYEACVTARKCTPPNKGGDCNWGRADRADHPVNCVDFEQATAYCASVDKRLPTEEEWEYAARGTDGRRFPWKGGDPTNQLCWNGEGNELGKGKHPSTCPVGSYPAGASPFGILDMAGNVWEWTSAAYCPYDKPDCGDARKVIRGGAWNNLVPSFVRSQDRTKEAATARNDNVGFRCAK
jgi:formylglycine-generating enzyme required for sulfatase activity